MKPGAHSQTKLLFVALLCVVRQVPPFRQTGVDASQIVLTEN